MDENFQDYEKPAMFIATCVCDWKCAIDGGFDCSICQNSEVANQKDIRISIGRLVERYIQNKITKAIVFGGLEPMLQFEDVLEFIKTLRKINNDMVVIYTGYYPEEIDDKIEQLKKYKNIIVKFGRYIPNKPSKYDKVLGIELVSENQFATKIS